MGIVLVFTFFIYLTHRLYISWYVYENDYVAVDYLLTCVSLENKL
jgi:hypothetical protein